MQSAVSSPKNRSTRFSQELLVTTTTVHPLKDTNLTPNIISVHRPGGSFYSGTRPAHFLSSYMLTHRSNGST